MKTTPKSRARATGATERGGGSGGESKHHITLDLARALVAAEDEQLSEIRSKDTYPPFVKADGSEGRLSSDIDRSYLERFRALAQNDAATALADYEDWKRCPVDVSAFPLVSEKAVFHARIARAVEILLENEKADTTLRHKNALVDFLLCAVEGGLASNGTPAAAAMGERLVQAGRSKRAQEAFETGGNVVNSGLYPAVLAMVAEVMGLGLSTVKKIHGTYRRGKSRGDHREPLH